MTDPQHIGELLPRALTHPAPTTPQTYPQAVDNPQHAKACPNCGAEPGQLCRTVAGIPMPTQTHRARPRPRKAPRKRTPRAPVPQHLAGVSEAQFAREVVKVARAAGWRVNHTRTSRTGDTWQTATTVRGWPDWTLWHPGGRGVLFVELKAERGVVSPAQTEVLESLSAAGARALVWRPSDWDSIVAILEDVGDALPPPPV